MNRLVGSFELDMTRERTAGDIAELLSSADEMGANRNAIRVRLVPAPNTDRLDRVSYPVVLRMEWDL